MTSTTSPADRLRSTFGYLNRETVRRAEGGAARALRLHDDELRDLVEVLRLQVGESGTVAPIASEGAAR